MVSAGAPSATGRLAPGHGVRGRLARQSRGASRARSMVSFVSRTHRLELDDQTLREWDAVVLDSGPDGIVLDRSAFYPGGGGQPPDHGVLLWGGVQTRVVDARKSSDDVYRVPAEGDPVPVPGT